MIARILLLSFGFTSLGLHAQITAGEVPAGATALDLGLELFLNFPNSIDSASIEIDCDDFHDLEAVLIQGQPEVDGPNIAMLRFVDDDLEICATVTSPSRPRYYAFGEALTCAGEHAWQSDGSIVLGDVGSFSAIGPVSVDSMYVAVRRGGSIGWMLLSFDLLGVNSVRLQVHQVLSLCGPTGIAANGEAPVLSLHPNPSQGQAVRLEGMRSARSIEVLDATGKLVAHYGPGTRTFPAPARAGAYFVRVVRRNGAPATVRLLRY